MFDSLFQSIVLYYNGREGQSPKAESIKSEAQVNKLKANSIAPAPEISALDEILSHESGGLSLRSDQSTDGGGQKKEVTSSCIQLYTLAFHSFLCHCCLL